MNNRSIKSGSNENSKGTRNSRTATGDEDQVHILTTPEPQSSLALWLSNSREVLSPEAAIRVPRQNL